MTWWQLLLYPFAFLYDLITRLRNYLYDQGISKSFRFQANLIAVGNLSMGGTGKTPFISYLIRYFLSAEKHVATLSRGYGRKTRGFRMVGPSDNALTVGDEPYMYYRQYRDTIRVTVAEERYMAIPEILYYQPQNDVILLDDAFQHRSIQTNFNILVTTFQNPFYTDFVFPAGWLRESRRNASRAHVVIFTKCPWNLTAGEMEHIKSETGKYTSAPVFFTTLEYGQPQALFEFDEERKPLHNKVLLISGIADPTLFDKHVKEKYQVLRVHHFEDHHDYTQWDVKGIVEMMRDDISLLTTEKDAARLVAYPALRSFSCYYLPVSIRFIKEEALFHSMINDSLKDYF